MKVPENITVICIGKSTYARLGIIVNTSPAEAGVGRSSNFRV